MIDDLRIHLAIIMYLLGCFALMIYNAIIIYRKKRQRNTMARRTESWMTSINKEILTREVIETLSLVHEREIVQRLNRVEDLIAYMNALNHFKQDHKQAHFFNNYMNMLVKSNVFFTLSIDYLEKRNEEKAYFAYFISQYPQAAQTESGVCTNTTNTIVSYINDSDIYCRTNVLKALCKVGDMYGIVNVLQFYSDSNSYVHHKLLAEDLFNFAGDREVLALFLWDNYRTWNFNIVVGVVTFITMFSTAFKTAFLPALKNKSLNAEIRLAIIRYYKKYHHAPAQDTIIEYLGQTDNYAFANQAASALSEYPSNATTSALTIALDSDNWYVRRNAIVSLIALGEYTGGMVDSDLPSTNTEARQLIQYTLEHASEEKV